MWLIILIIVIIIGGIIGAIVSNMVLNGLEMLCLLGIIISWTCCSGGAESRQSSPISEVDSIDKVADTDSLREDTIIEVQCNTEVKKKEKCANSFDETEVDNSEVYGESQMELNIGYEEAYVKQKERVEREFKSTVKSLGNRGCVIAEEQDEWLAYKEAVKALALEYLNNSDASSSPMAFYEQLINAYSVIELSYKVIGNKTGVEPVGTLNITDSLLNLWYDKYIAEYDLFNIYSDESKAVIDELVRKEQTAWNVWMSTRYEIESKLSGRLKDAYSACTNNAKRLKLIQLMNQDQGLGTYGNSTEECLLKTNCSDEELMAYPGFYSKWNENY